MVSDEKAKELRVILNTTGISDNSSSTQNSIWNNKELRRIVLSEHENGTTAGEISKLICSKGYNLTATNVLHFLNKRANCLSNREVREVKNSIFYDIEKLDDSIGKIIDILETKIEDWKDNEKKNKELLLGISQLREYQILALKKLGIIKDSIQKVDRQFNQTNIIVAQHQTDYLKELVMDGKIKIVDSTLLDLVFGKAVNHSESITDMKGEENATMVEEKNQSE